MIALRVGAGTADQEVAADPKPLVGVALVALLDGAVAVDRNRVVVVDGGALERGVDAAAVLVRSASAVRELALAAISSV